METRPENASGFVVAGVGDDIRDANSFTAKILRVSLLLPRFCEDKSAVFHLSVVNPIFYKRPVVNYFPPFTKFNARILLTGGV